MHSIRSVPSRATALVPKAVPHSSDFSGDTLIGFDARKFLDNTSIQEIDPPDYKRDEGQQDHSRGLLEDALNVHDPEDSLYLPIHTPWARNYVSRGKLNTLKRSNRLFPLVRASPCPEMQNEDHTQALLTALHPDPEHSRGNSRLTSSGTVEIHPLPSPTSSSNISHSESKWLFFIVL